MSTEKAALKSEAVNRETVTLKKNLIQGGEDKPAGDKIEVTANQKKRLIESEHI